MLMLYRALETDQPNSYTCVDTTTVHIIDESTGAVKRPDPLDIRKATGKAWNVGLTYGEAAEAAEEVSNVDIDPEYGVTPAIVIANTTSGEPMGISIDLAVTAGTECQTGFATKGGHTMYLPAKAYSLWPGGDPCACEKHTTIKHNEFRYQDPGTYRAGYRQISAELLFRAAKSRTNGNGINLLVGLDTMNVWRRRVKTGSAWSRPTRQSTRTRSIPNRPIHVIRIVEGQPYWRKDGSRTTAWYETAAGDFIKCDRLDYRNVEAPL